MRDAATLVQPVVDCFYSASRLRAGGLLVLDDVQVPAPRLVADYMAGLSAVRRVARTPKWAAFELAKEPRLPRPGNRPR